MDCKIYRKFNIDLESFTDSQLIEHFNCYGKNENRIYNIESLNNYFSDKNNAIQFLNTYPNLWETLWKEYEILQKYSTVDREEISLESKTRLFYYGKEVLEYKAYEENILNDILPDDCKDLNILNILNIGAGERQVHHSLINIDFQRNLQELSDNINTTNSLLCDMDNLIFKGNSVDGIIALNVWVHSEDPVKTFTEWLRVLKPGGKIGIINPDYRYTWSASNDNQTYGHKWNTDMSITIKLLKKHFNNIEIIKFNTLKYKISYDIVIQKKGKFIKNNLTNKKTLSGYEIDKGINKDISYYYHNNNINT